jgi:outer membrane protein TolC
MRAIVLALLSTAVTTASADELDRTAETKSLPELFGVAVRVAPALEQASYRADTARAQADAADGAFDTTIVGNVGYLRTKNLPVSFGIDHELDKTYSLSIRKLLPTNGTLELIGKLDDLTIPVVDSMNNVVDQRSLTTSLTARLTQPLLRDFGPVAADRVRTAARQRASAETIRRTATARAFALQVVTAYWELALAWRTLEIRRDAVESAQKQLGFVEAGIRTGKYSESEVFPVKQALAVRQQDTLEAQLDVVDRSIALRRQIGMEVEAGKLALKPTKLPDPAPIEIDVKAVIAKALATSDDVKAALAEQRAADATLAGSRRGLLPRADLQLEGGPVGSDAQLGKSFGKIGDGYTVTGNLVVELPVGNHAARGQYGIDRAAARDLAFQVGKTRADIAADAARAVYELGVHRESVALGVGAVEIGKLNVEAETRKFELGKSTSAEIIRRQDDLQNVRLREAQERARYQIALAALDTATGVILEKYGIHMESR